MASTAELPRRMFSQRGNTCGTDVIYTVFFEADPLRSYFRPLLERDPARMIGSDDDLVSAMGYAIQRYQKMSALPAPAEKPTMKRSNSANTGEACEMKVRSTLGDVEGITAETATQLLDDILVHDKFDILPYPGFIQVLHIPASAPSLIKPKRTFAIILGLERYVAPKIRYNSNNNNLNRKYYRSFYGGGGSAVKSGAGHEVGFLKQGDDWYFLDNDIGWLHKIADPDFVPVHVLGTLKAGNSITCILNGRYRAALLNFTIITDTAVYGGDREEYSPDRDHFKSAEGHVLMTDMKKGGRRRTRKAHRQ